jgi:hypothetical protein
MFPGCQEKYRQPQLQLYEGFTATVQVLRLDEGAAGPRGGL